MKESLRLALESSVVKRAFNYAVVVGLILIAINHGDAILRGDLTGGRLSENLFHHADAGKPETKLDR
jgi:hypothetical protein